MSLTLLTWLLLFAGLAILAFKRPAYGVALYMLSYFLCPPFWWWGSPIASYRWNMYSGLILLAAVGLSRIVNPAVNGRHDKLARWLPWIALLIAANATVVHLALADNWTISGESYTLLIKFVILFFLIFLAVRTESDIRLVYVAIVLGAAYIGYEVTINERGEIRANRLEGIGAPGASAANEHASLMITILPLTGALFLAGRKWERLAMLPAAPFILNVVLLCNSRGAFLGAITSAVVFFLAAPRAIRGKALKILALGIVATWFMLGDPRIVERFMTSFTNAEERDSSAQSRIDFARAGLAMIEDYPLGAGGHGFKKVHGVRYLRKLGVANEAHSVHNGFVNEACEWGVQGLALRLAFVIVAMIVIFRSARRHAASNDIFGALIGAALAAGMAGFLVTCLFGDRLDNEWGYWFVALAVAHACFVPERREATSWALAPRDWSLGLADRPLTAADTNIYR